MTKTIKIQTAEFFINSVLFIVSSIYNYGLCLRVRHVTWVY